MVMNLLLHNNNLFMISPSWIYLGVPRGLAPGPSGEFHDGKIKIFHLGLFLGTGVEC